MVLVPIRNQLFLFSCALNWVFSFSCTINNYDEKIAPGWDLMIRIDFWLRRLTFNKCLIRVIFIAFLRSTYWIILLTAAVHFLHLFTALNRVFIALHLISHAWWKHRPSLRLHDNIIFWFRRLTFNKYLISFFSNNLFVLLFESFCRQLPYTFAPLLYCIGLNRWFVTLNFSYMMKTSPQSETSW